VWARCWIAILEPKVPYPERLIQSPHRAFSCFSLLILNDRAAPSYQLLDLSLAVLPLGMLFLIADLSSFEVGVLVSSFLDNFLPLINRPNSTSSFDHLVGAAECGEAVEGQVRTRKSVAIDSSLVRPEARLQRLLD
jgi:hypothetical protein